MRTGRWNGRRQADGQPSIVRAGLTPVDSSLIMADVHFLETSSLTGDNVESPFLLAARSILLSIESGALDPEKAGSGVSYGDRALRRVSSSSRLSFGSLSVGRRRGPAKIGLKDLVPGAGRRCC
jgi:hypothetical protein